MAILFFARADLPDVADAEGDAAGQAAADQAGLQPGGHVRGHRGRGRGEGGARRRSSSSCANPKSFQALGAKVPEGRSCCTGRRAPARRCSRRRSRTSPARSSSPSRPPSFVEMFAGLGAARIRRLFAIARKHEPAIIFIDELDAVGGRRGSDISGEKDQTLNQLLVEMDGFSSSGRVVVIAASNLLEKLDPALLRPGPLRPPGVRRAAGRQGPPRRAPGPHARQAAGGRRPAAGRPADQRAHGRGPREHLQRGGDLRDAPGREGASRSRTSTRPSSASSPACSQSAS